MALDDQPESSLEIIDISHADGFSHQPRHAVAPLVVQALDDTGFAAAFVARPMLPVCEPFSIGFVEIGIDQLPSIISRQRKPQAHKAFGATVADGKADNLSSQARDGNPQIAIASPETIADD